MGLLGLSVLGAGMAGEEWFSGCVGGWVDFLLVGAGGSGGSYF